ncbi:MAG TPA: MCE family protein [Acidimicrobiales bacterium]|nr:MCE family protein [Acidimicrobiales bacterium]
MDAVQTFLRSTALKFMVAGLVVVAGVVVGIDVTRSDATYPLKAIYSSAPGLFPGASVDVLGVPVGTVTSVTNVDNRVEVGMRVKDGTYIPAAAIASLVSPELLGQPDVDLNPGYTGGPHLRPGATIPEARTSVPVSTDQLLKQLQRSLQALNPTAVGNLITNLSQDLDGQGTALNALIHGAAGTLQLLADKGNDLGRLNGTLAQVTGALDSDTAQIEQLVREYDTVSTVIAQHSGQLNDAITQLAGATTSLVGLLTPNLQPLEADVGTVTTAGRTLDRNIANVDEVLQQANNLFHGAQRAFDPTYDWLNLNSVLPPGVTGAYVTGLIRDRLAGICRRLVANHSSGLSPSTLTTLQQCGDPTSGFFDPLLNNIPTILNALTGLTSSPPTASSATPSALLQQGLAQIGHIGASPGASSTTAPHTTNGATTTTPSSTTTTTSPNSLCSLLGALLGCKGAGSTNTSQGTTGSGGLGGLLTKKAAAGAQPASANANANLADASGPSLTAPAARLLPPLPGTAHRHRAGHHAQGFWSWL